MLEHPADGEAAGHAGGLRRREARAAGSAVRPGPRPATGPQGGGPRPAGPAGRRGRPGPAALQPGGRPGHRFRGPGAGPVGLATPTQDVRPGPGGRTLLAAVCRVQGHAGDADEPGAPPLPGAGGAPLDGPRVGGSVRRGRRVASGAGLRALPAPLLRARPRAGRLPRRLPRGPDARVVQRPAVRDRGHRGAPGLLQARAQPEGAAAPATSGDGPLAAAARLPAEPHAEPGQEGVPDGVRVPGGRGRGAEPGPGPGPQRIPADRPVRPPCGRGPRGRATPATPGAAGAAFGRRAAPLAARRRATLRLRHPDLRAGRARALPPQQERLGASGQQGAGPAVPPQGLHLQSVRDQLQPVAGREGRGYGPGARGVQRDQLRVPVRALLRGEGHDAGARRALHGLRLHPQYSSVRDVRRGGAVPSAVAGLHGALGPAEQAGAARLEGDAEQREQAPFRPVQEGGGHPVSAGSSEHGAAKAKAGTRQSVDKGRAQTKALALYVLVHLTLAVTAARMAAALRRPTLFALLAADLDRRRHPRLRSAADSTF